jgi:hypothetical protein
MARPNELANGVINKAVAVSSHEVDRFVESVRRRNPRLSPAELIDALGRSYTGLVATSGGAAGGVAAAPGVGTGVAVAASVADVGSFTVSSAVYILGVASIHGIAVEDLERRRALILGMLAGAGGSESILRVAERTGQHWGRQITSAVPMTTIRQINKILGRNFVTKYGTKQGIVVIGKLAPFGIGAGIGAGANALFARVVVKSTAKAFGPPPPAFLGTTTPLDRHQ